MPPEYRSLLDIADDAEVKAARMGSNTRRPHSVTPACIHCGAPQVEFKHALSKGLAGTLIRIYRKPGPVRARDLGLNYTAQSCLQKLRYWNLIEHITKDDKRTGLWSITETGERFVRATIRLPRHVWTYRASVVEYEGEEVLITDLVQDFNWRVDYAAEARQHTEVAA